MEQSNYEKRVAAGLLEEWPEEMDKFPTKRLAHQLSIKIQIHIEAIRVLTFISIHYLKSDPSQNALDYTEFIKSTL